MDLGSIDKLVAVLEKAALRKGSPPTVVNGVRGVWRTIKGYRMFIELDGNSLGRVISGPPSFAGKSLDDVDSSTWGKLTPEGTDKAFESVEPAKGGIENLKRAIPRALPPDDTRREAIREKDTVEELVPLARSAGFTDDEIRAALKGRDVFQTSASPHRQLPNRLMRGREAAGGGEGKPPVVERKPAAQPPDENFQQIVEAFNAPSKDREARAEEVAEAILRRAEGEEDTQTKLKLQYIGHGLNAGALTISEAREQVRDIAENKGANTPVPSQKDVDVLHDRVQIKQFVDTHEKKIEDLAESLRREAAGDMERARDLAMVKLLQELEQKINLSQVKPEIVKVREAIESGSMSRGMGIRRILQILRLILALIPGL